MRSAASCRGQCIDTASLWLALRFAVAGFAPNSIGLLQRMADAGEQVCKRLVKAAEVFAKAKLPYAVVGGNAVAAWVATVDEAAVRYIWPDSQVFTG